MGDGLSDAGTYYGTETNDGSSESSDAPKSREWKTPPLWGVATSGPYLHDGRAQTLSEAINLHGGINGGQAQSSSERFQALSKVDQRHLINFLLSLAAPRSAQRVPTKLTPAEMIEERQLAQTLTLRYRREPTAATRMFGVLEQGVERR
jgi:cytochrome c peroxidase